LKKLPNLFEYFSYILNMNGCVVGPVYDYYDYSSFINKTNGYEKIPSSLKRTMQSIAMALLC
jgi:MBOAT, membrane-bound O-acyltransferase family